jgi:hypothetical protein
MNLAVVPSYSCDGTTPVSWCCLACRRQQEGNYDIVTGTRYAQGGGVSRTTSMYII